MATTTNQLNREAFEQLPDDGMRTEFMRGVSDSLTLPGILEDWNFPVAQLFGRP